jgi:hypothetical protein
MSRPPSASNYTAATPHRKVPSFRGFLAGCGAGGLPRRAPLVGDAREEAPRATRKADNSSRVAAGLARRWASRFAPAYPGQRGSTASRAAVRRASVAVGVRGSGSSRASAATAARARAPSGATGARRSAARTGMTGSAHEKGSILGSELGRYGRSKTSGTLARTWQPVVTTGPDVATGRTRQPDAATRCGNQEDMHAKAFAAIRRRPSALRLLDSHPTSEGRASRSDGVTLRCRYRSGHCVR